jgi:hypothetical protein
VHESIKNVYPPRGLKNANYWWNEDIANLRRTVQKMKRIAQRSDNSTDDIVNETKKKFKVKKKELKLAITKSKKLAWRNFMATLEVDPWRKPYKSIISKITYKKSIDTLNKDQINRIIETLSITTRNEETDGGIPECIPDEEEEVDNNIIVDMDELENAMDRLKPAKASGIDGHNY